MVYFPAVSSPLLPSSLASPTLILTITGITHCYPHHYWHHPLLPSPSLASPTVTLTITGITHCYPHHHWHHPLLPLQNVNLPNLPKSQTKNPQESPGPSEKPGSIWEKVDPGGIYISFCLRCVVHSFQLYHFTCRVGVTGLTN